MSQQLIGHAVQRVDITTAAISLSRHIPYATTLSYTTEGRRLSWPEHTVGWQLAQGCLQMTRVRFEPAT